MAENTKKYPNEQFVEFLNTLHNASANNQNAITELSITNPYFNKTMVERHVGTYIRERLETDMPQIFVLTGHAGDGKTGLLYQILKNWGVVVNGDELRLSAVVPMPSGRQCQYVKDFSELNPEERDKCINKAKSDCINGITTFIVANAGPLITCFDRCFSEKDALSLLDAVDTNDGEQREYSGTPISVINMAAIDNTTFVKPYLEKLLSDELWNECEDCEKCNYCPIRFNRSLIWHRPVEFITDNYIYQLEYGKKLTIRQIVAHLSYSLTGGLECRKVKNMDRQMFNHLFTNTFFGYKGFKPNKDALSIKAIGDTFDEAYDQKKLKADEILFIERNLHEVFEKQIADMLTEAGKWANHSEEWQRAVRRAYMMLNIDTDDENRTRTRQDVFSYWFPMYLRLRSGDNHALKENDLVQEALQMMFTETIASKAHDIPITMKRENGITQSVQLVYDSKQKKKIRVSKVPAQDYDTQKRYWLRICVDGEVLKTNLNLPLFDYFEEVGRGAVATDIDPMLSQGIDSLKAQIISKCDVDSDKSEIELLTLSDAGWDTITAESVGDEWRVY